MEVAVARPSQSMNDLSLFEDLRKLWSSVILRNVVLAWAASQGLNKWQHGFIAGRSMAPIWGGDEHSEHSQRALPVVLGHQESL